MRVSENVRRSWSDKTMSLGLIKVHERAWKLSFLDVASIGGISDRIAKIRSIHSRPSGLVSKV